jgi:TonB family protein
MNRHTRMAALMLLMLLPCTIQPCLGQVAGQDAAARARVEKYDAPENNELRLVSSERGFRASALRKAMPEFPEEALKAGAQGMVVLSLYQDGEGNAAKIKVVESPHPALTEAAIKAVKQWKWRKFRSGGIDRPVLSKLSFNFIIENEVGRVEDPVDDGPDGAYRNLRDIDALRLKATWPDDSASSKP